MNCPRLDRLFVMINRRSSILKHRPNRHMTPWWCSLCTSAGWTGHGGIVPEISVQIDNEATAINIRTAGIAIPAIHGMASVCDQWARANPRSR